MSEDDLERLLRSKGSRRKHRAWRCPDEVTLAAFVDGRLPESARSRVQGHLADCGLCVEHVAAVLLSRETATPEVPAPLLARARELAESPTDGAPAFAWRWSAVSAAAGLTLVAAVLVWQVSTAPTPETSPAQVRSNSGQLMPPEVLSPEEGSVVGREPMDFRWRAVAGAIYYEIQLVTAEGDVLWQGRTEETGAQLPGTVRIAPGQEVYVWVRAHVLDGKILKSDPVGFTLDNEP
jgi:hypothetical protein